MKNPDKPPSEIVDEATARLQHQLAALRQSEEIQHRAAMMPQRQMTREEKLAAWRTGGIERGRRTHSAITPG
jgi:hypothetical protein